MVQTFWTWIIYELFKIFEGLLSLESPLTNSNCLNKNFKNVSTFYRRYLILNCTSITYDIISNHPSTAGFTPRAKRCYCYSSQVWQGVWCWLSKRNSCFTSQYPGVVDGHHAPDSHLLPLTSYCDNTEIYVAVCKEGASF